MNEYPNNNSSFLHQHKMALIAFAVLASCMLFGYFVFTASEKFGYYGNTTSYGYTSGDTMVYYWHAPDETSLENNPDKATILYGKDLIAHTSLYFGANGSVSKNAINGMNCQNCHLEAGTKIFGNNYGSVFATYPKYRPRSGTIENIQKRVTDCFERSLNGKAPDADSKEMKAITAYINWLGKDVKKGDLPAGQAGKANGSGFKDIAFLKRAADPALGKAVYIQKCQSCHQPNGEGVQMTDKSAFIYPPLWGNNSYNTGAGLYRLASFAKYVKYNMPNGTNFMSPQLSNEEAWDVAAFVNSQPRPVKDISKDWPKIEEKVFDHPFGPYADGFSETQHKYGPFQPIKDKLDAMKKQRDADKQKKKI